jgi:hypothetical protein
MDSLIIDVRVILIFKLTFKVVFEGVCWMQLAQDVEQ